ncbi:uncharacterized protein AMSG_10942 [Thecamonas trahens ATCC 50062]|uniref:Uncharacterized protein n=1 Tax=Thecamonas trahens ATCC 50062 TaxID=461836 RepID=A0A0L0DSQ5_THETB|nr:hypothetical protein AMSG_10942 [Thecamonas trahens ATCC 50062]KNC55300.1 hypothetical protein AMSG_10942 [Thecamonas trahens ATCC 50062]|eukprot:XP_013753120.1 hypothetical protein AMSG_10942 [Thecamonas trahens ATCC 50062]
MKIQVKIKSKQLLFAEPESTPPVVKLAAPPPTAGLPTTARASRARAARRQRVRSAPNASDTAELAIEAHAQSASGSTAGPESSPGRAPAQTSLRPPSGASALVPSAPGLMNAMTASKDASTAPSDEPSLPPAPALQSAEAASGLPSLTVDLLSAAACPPTVAANSAPPPSLGSGGLTSNGLADLFAEPKDLVYLKCSLCNSMISVDTIDAHSAECAATLERQTRIRAPSTTSESPEELIQEGRGRSRSEADAAATVAAPDSGSDSGEGELNLAPIGGASSGVRAKGESTKKAAKAARKAAKAREKAAASAAKRGDRSDPDLRAVLAAKDREIDELKEALEEKDNEVARLKKLLQAERIKSTQLKARLASA